MKKHISFILLFLFLLPLSFVQAEISVVSSLEWLADTSEAIAIYNVIDFTKKEDDYKIKLNLSKNLKGKAPRRQSVKYYIIDRQQKKIKAIDKKHQFLIFFKNNNIGQLQYCHQINLTIPAKAGTKFIAANSSFELLTDKEKIIKCVSERLKTHPKQKILKHDEYPPFKTRFDVEIPGASDLYCAVYGGSACYLLVPDDLKGGAKLVSQNYEQITEIKKIINSKKGNLIEAEVIKVVDGYALEVFVKGQKKSEIVRLIGAGLPDLKKDKKTIQEMGKIASQVTENWVKGKKIFLEFDVEKRDRYGRLLAYVHVPFKGGGIPCKILFNQILVSGGYAQVYTFPPNVKYKDRFLKTQREARKNKKGFWGNKWADVKPREEKKSKDVSGFSILYIVSKNSKVYHNPNCKWAKSIKEENIIKFHNKKEAGKGRRACKVCKP
jgi:micrococcal nuclease